MAYKEDIIVNVTTKGGDSVTGLTKNLKDAKDATEKLKDTTDLLGGKDSIFNKIKEAVGSIIPSLKGAEEGLDGVLMKMWKIVSNPIGLVIAAIVVSLKFLYESFQNSVAGGKEIQQVFAAISAVGTQLKDGVFAIGRAIMGTTEAIYKFINLDFKGASEAMKKANKEASTSYEQLGDAIDGTTYNAVKALEKRRQANDNARKAQELNQAKTNELLLKSRETLTDETASIKDKKKALEEVTKAEKASSAEKVRIAAEDLKIMQEDAAAMKGETKKKMMNDLTQKEIELRVARTENAATGIKLNKQENALNSEAAALAKAAADEKKARMKEAEDLRKEALKQEEDRLKTIADLEKKYLQASQDFSDKSDQEKLNRQKERDLAEINALKTNAEEKANLTALLNEKYFNLQLELDDKNLKLKEEKDLALLNLEQKKIDNKRSLELNQKQWEIDNLVDPIAKQQALNDFLTEQYEVDAERATREIEDKNATAEQKVEAEKKYTERAQKYAQDLADGKKKLLTAEEQNEKLKAEGRIALAGKVFEIIGTMATEGSALAKGMAVSQAIINTYSGIDSALSAPTTIPDPFGTPLKFANAAAIGIAGFQNVQKILSTQTGSAAGGGAAAAAPSVPSAPSFNLVKGTASNQISEALGRSSAPIQAYVVSSDVTSAQSFDRNIIKNSKL